MITRTPREHWEHWEPRFVVACLGFFLAIAAWWVAGMVAWGWSLTATPYWWRAVAAPGMLVALFVVITGLAVAVSYDKTLH